MEQEQTMTEKVLMARLQEEMTRSVNLQVALESVYQQLEQYKEDNAKLEEQLQSQDK